MSRYLSLLLLILFHKVLFGQTDSIPTPEIQIENSRRELILAFENDDRMNAQFWLDSLQRLDDDNFLSLYWDERWLFYIWLENYAPLFTEVQQFDALEEKTFYKIRPTPDSLFKMLDARLFAMQPYLFDQIRKAWLSTEERAFTTLLVNYLLRLSFEEPEATMFDTQLKAFLKQYPDSRFKKYIYSRMFNAPPAANWAIGLDILFANGNWTDGLERSFRPMFGADMAFNYWRNRLNSSLRMIVGGQKLARDIEEGLEVWPKDDPSTFLAFELDAGYDLYNKPGLRIFPSIGIGFSTLRPPQSEEEPLPDAYDNFKFRGWHYIAALQADVKFSMGKGSVASTYHGVRIRLGHRWLHLDKDNPAMQGNMFFFAVGYTIFGRQAQN